eukprot:2555874-Pleurochrysis_carterae.AAC.1
MTSPLCLLEVPPLLLSTRPAFFSSASPFSRPPLLVTEFSDATAVPDRVYGHDLRRCACGHRVSDATAEIGFSTIRFASSTTTCQAHVE